jgi:glycine cleavage system H protein
VRQLRSKGSEVKEGLLYGKDHEWAKVEENVVRVGVSDYAQQLLTDVVYADLPKAGDKVSKGDSFMVLESVKSVSDVYSPVTGVIVEVNEELVDYPEKVNESPYGEGWLVTIELQDSSELEDLMSAEDYRDFLDSED